MRKYLFIILFVSCSLTSYTQSTSVPFTLEDRDRIIRTEEKLESLRNDMNTRFESMNTKFNAVNQRIDTLYWGFGVLISLMLFLFGYIVWDRRTAMLPLRDKTDNTAEKLRLFETILKEEAKTNKRLAEILRTYGLL